MNVQGTRLLPPSDQHLGYFLILYFPHMCVVCTCSGAHMCASACRRLKVAVRSPPWLLFHLIHQARLSQSTPELSDVVSLAGQLAAGDFLFLPSETHPSGICHGFWGPECLSSWCVTNILTAESSQQSHHSWQWLGRMWVGARHTLCHYRTIRSPKC